MRKRAEYPHVNISTVPPLGLGSFHHSAGGYAIGGLFYQQLPRDPPLNWMCLQPQNELITGQNIDCFSLFGWIPWVTSENISVLALWSDETKVKLFVKDILHLALFFAYIITDVLHYV